jgi:hypothetical protein
MAFDYVGWVRRTNSRWIVHHDLGHDTEVYLDHLARNDPQRLARSCRLAYILVQEGPSGEDPKPRFYSGVFSLATGIEIQNYLRSHWLVRAVLTGSPSDLAQNPAGYEVSEPTRRKILAVREAVARLRGKDSPVWGNEVGNEAEGS